MLRGLIALLVTIGLGGISVAQDLNSLRPWIPEDINAVAVVRAGELLKSPRAERESWRHSSSEGFLSGSFTLPPDCELYLRATRFRPGAGDDWSVALLSFSRPVDIQRVAEQEQSPVQQVQSKPAVLSRRNCFFAVLTPQLLGVVSPAHRQDLARWIERSQRKHDATLNRYLDELLLGQSAGITLAIDLSEMFEPDRLKSKLISMGAMIGHQQNIDQIAARVMNVRGLRLDVYVTDQTMATLTLDFASPVGSDAPLMRAILLEALGDLGVALDSFDHAQPQVDGSSLRLAAQFTDEDLRRVMTLVLTPHPVAAPPAAAAPPPPNEVPASRGSPRVVGDNNVRYFRAVDQILRDLTKVNRNAKDYAKTATWHDNFASKIEQLPSLAVDPDLVRYGDSIAAKLRSLAASLRGVSVQVNTLNSAIVYNTKYDPGWEQVGWWSYGYKPPSWSVETNLGQVRQNQAEAIAAGAQDRETIWQMINDERARTLTSMTERYGPSFDEGVRAKKFP
jgi:hypothetical protein